MSVKQRLVDPLYRSKFVSDGVTEISLSAAPCNRFDPAPAPEYVLRKCKVGRVKTC